MADIARLFLDGARPITTSPQRVSPKDRAATQPQPSTPTPPNGLAASRPEPKSSFTLPPTLLGPHRPNRRRRLEPSSTPPPPNSPKSTPPPSASSANRNHAFVFELLGQESTRRRPPHHRRNRRGGMPDLQIARAPLHPPRLGVGTWLIAAPDPRNENFPPSPPPAPAHRLIACSTDGGQPHRAAYQQP